MQLVKDPHEMVALIEVSVSLLSNDPSCFLATMWNFLKHFFNSSISLRNSFEWATSLQERITPSETNCCREDCLIFSNNYLEKRSQTLVGKSMNSSLTFENFQANFCGLLCLL